MPTPKHSNGEHHKHQSTPTVETWTLPTPPYERVPTAGELVVDKPPKLHRQVRRWYVSDITENTRVAIKVGSIGAAVVALLLVGSWWGGLQSERTQVQAAQAAQHATDERQDGDIRQLRESIATINTNMALIKQGQDTSLPQLIRQSNYGVEVLRNIEVALAKEGVTVKEHGP
jgi:hypothetical protein